MLNCFSFSRLLSNPLPIVKNFQSTGSMDSRINGPHKQTHDILRATHDQQSRLLWCTLIRRFLFSSQCLSNLNDPHYVKTNEQGCNYNGHFNTPLCITSQSSLQNSSSIDAWQFVSNDSPHCLQSLNSESSSTSPICRSSVNLSKVIPYSFHNSSHALSPQAYQLLQCSMSMDTQQTIVISFAFV